MTSKKCLSSHFHEGLSLLESDLQGVLITEHIPGAFVQSLGMLARRVLA